MQILQELEFFSLCHDSGPGESLKHRGLVSHFLNSPELKVFLCLTIVIRKSVSNRLGLKIVIRKSVKALGGFLGSTPPLGSAPVT